MGVVGQESGQKGVDEGEPGGTFPHRSVLVHESRHVHGERCQGDLRVLVVGEFPETLKQLAGLLSDELPALLGAEQVAEGA